MNEVLFSMRINNCFYALQYSCSFNQVPVVQRGDNSIQWINPYPADKMYSKEYILSAE